MVLNTNLEKHLKRVTIDKRKMEEIEPSLNFLFVVFNENEINEMQCNLKPLNGYSVILDYIDDESMQHFFIGRFFKYNIVLAKTADMGARNVNSVINVINRAIQLFRPRYIVMPGIAAGLDDKVTYGDVVIADKVIGYESEKVGPTEIIARYPEFRSPRLFNLFCSANVKNFSDYLEVEINNKITSAKSIAQQIAPNCESNCPRDVKEDFSWTNAIENGHYPKVYTGNYISGEKLLDNAIYREYLKSRFKEVMALDMEGAGVASASTFNRVYDWLVIKGISDLGDGNKSKSKKARQIYAMKNVITVLKSVFNDELSFPASSLKQVSGYERKNVLISASQCDKGAYADITEAFMETLANRLILNNNNVITGYGIDVGPSVLFGIYEGCRQLRLNVQEYTNRFQCFPFPRGSSKDEYQANKLEKCKQLNRKIMCSTAKIAIFAFGNKYNERIEKIVEADGMFEELDLVLNNEALILPIGCTKGTARKILDAVVKKSDIYLKPYFIARQKYRDTATSIDDVIAKYIKKLKEISSIELNSNNVERVVNLVIELINLYG